MLLKDLGVSEKVELRIKRGNENLFSFSTKIADKDENGIFVLVSLNDTGLFRLKPDDKISLIFADVTAQKKWACKPDGIKPLDKVLVLYLIPGERGVSFNRRDAYRVSILKKQIIKMILGLITKWY